MMLYCNFTILLNLASSDQIIDRIGVLKIHFITFIEVAHFFELFPIIIRLMRRCNITFLGHFHNLFESLNQHGTKSGLRTSFPWLIIIVICILLFISLSVVVCVPWLWLIHVKELQIVIFIIELDCFRVLIIEQVCFFGVGLALIEF